MHLCCPEGLSSSICLVLTDIVLIRKLANTAIILQVSKFYSCKCLNNNKNDYVISILELE